MNKINNGWEVFEGPRTRSRGGMNVRVYKSGQLSLTDEVQQALDAEEVVLLFNHEGRKIGLRPATPHDRRSYKLRKPQRQTTWLLNAAAFLKYYELEDLKGQAFPAMQEEGMVVIDLQRPAA